MRFVNRPYYLAGTAVPDWLSVADRGVRVRAGRIEPLADNSGSDTAELAAGILQHLEDDRAFHKSRAFAETTGDLVRLFRETLGADDGFRVGFLGHVITELLLDTVLIDERPGLLDAYYAALDRIDPTVVETAVNHMARGSTSRLAPFIPLFRQVEFLRDYSEPTRLLFRLNQVLARIRLRQLPDDFAEALAAARLIVEPRAQELLPF
jgi:hypothetical protein